MRARWWKVLGVASLVGVAATGVVVARDERRRRAYTPDEIRSRLRERYAEATDLPTGSASRDSTRRGTDLQPGE